MDASSGELILKKPDDLHRKERNFVIAITTIPLIVGIIIIPLTEIVVGVVVLSLLFVPLAIISNLLFQMVFISTYFELYENQLFIRTSWFFRKRNSEKTITIPKNNIQFIILVNRSLHIYHKDPKEEEMKRSWIVVSRISEKWKNELLNSLNKKKSKPKWNGPSIRNVEDVIDEKRSVRVFGAIIVMILLSVFFLMGLPVSIMMGYSLSSFSFFLETLAILTVMFGIPILIFTVPATIRDRRSYSVKGRYICILRTSWGAQQYTEYCLDDITSVQEKRIIPFLSYIFLKYRKFFKNPYSSAINDDLFLISFKEGYEFFEAGEYKNLSKEKPKLAKDYQHIAISKEVIDEFRKRGITIEEKT